MRSRSHLGGVALCLVVALAACSGPNAKPDEAAVAAAAPIPVSALDAKRPGTTIGDGFTVPEGAVLAGVLPVAKSAWDAYLVIPGDPRDVIRELRDQAAREGLTLAPIRRLGSSFCSQREELYECRAYAQSTETGPGLLVTFTRGPGTDEGAPPTSRMVISYSRGGRFTSLGPDATGDSGASFGPEPPPVASHWPPLPKAGETFAQGHPIVGDAVPLELEPGSRLTMPTTLTAPLIGCSWPGYEALIAIEGDPTSVLDAYVRQVEKNSGLTEPTHNYARELPPGVSMRSVGGGGGDSYGFRLVERPDKPALLLITTCHDA